MVPQITLHNNSAELGTREQTRRREVSLLNKNDKGIKAIIVYPMNALINSQFEEITKFKNKYEETGKKFPITFSQYTGQENQEARKKVKKELPDIILTNYMITEYRACAFLSQVA